MSALAMFVLLAVAALSIDVAYMYDKRDRLHAAADAAAKQGAIEARRNTGVSAVPCVDCGGALENFAAQQVAAHHLDPLGTTDIVVNRPPTSGPYTSQN